MLTQVEYDLQVAQAKIERLEERLRHILALATGARADAERSAAQETMHPHAAMAGTLEGIIISIRIDAESALGLLPPLTPEERDSLLVGAMTPADALAECHDRG